MRKIKKELTEFEKAVCSAWPDTVLSVRVEAELPLYDLVFHLRRLGRLEVSLFVKRVHELEREIAGLKAEQEREAAESSAQAPTGDIPSDQLPRYRCYPDGSGSIKWRSPEEFQHIELAVPRRLMKAAKDLCIPADVNRHAPTIESVYGKPLEQLTPPEGWEFSGEFRKMALGDVGAQMLGGKFQAYTANECSIAYGDRWLILRRIGLQ